MKIIPAVALFALVGACASAAPRPPDTQDAFLGGIQALCGQRFEGRVVTTDPADAAFAAATLTMHVRDCSPDAVRIPFHVGEDRSRTWVVTRTSTGLRLKHDHRHEDGTEDVLTQYGGDTVEAGTAERQEFPVDQFSKDLFTRENRTVSNTNVWAMEIHAGRMFAYELRRENRHFRVEFDLTRPLAD